MPLLGVAQCVYYAGHEVAHLAYGTRGPAHDNSQQWLTPAIAPSAPSCRVSQEHVNARMRILASHQCSDLPRACIMRNQLYLHDRTCKWRDGRGQLRGRRAAAPPSAAGRTAPGPPLAASWLARSPFLHRPQGADGRQQQLLVQPLAEGAARWPSAQLPRCCFRVRQPAGSALPARPASGAGQALPPQALAALLAQHCCWETGLLRLSAGP